MSVTGMYAAGCDAVREHGTRMALERVEKQTRGVGGATGCHSGSSGMLYRVYW
jgi:hypothetical protein